MTRLLLLAVSVAILGLLYARVGWDEVGSAVRDLDPPLLGLALLLFIPQVLLSGLRWAWTAGAVQPLGVMRATGLVLAASSLNVVLPSKMGDLVKGAFLAKDRPGGDVATGVGLALFEKAVDTVALASVMLAACAFAPPTDALSLVLASCAAAGIVAFACMLTPAASRRLTRLARNERPGVAGKVARAIGRLGGVLDLMRRDRARLARILVLSLALWALHLAQFTVVFLATRPEGATPLALLWSRIPMAIFVGLLPISFAGAGPRDVAMTAFLRAGVGAAPAVVLGAFATLRYVVPALIGLPLTVRLGIRPRPDPAAPSR